MSPPVTFDSQQQSSLAHPQRSHGSPHGSHEVSHFGGHGSQHPLDFDRQAAFSNAEEKSHAKRAGIDISAVIARA
jgi:hypothetical protein